MCSECHQSFGHHVMCPNYRPKEVGECALCGDTIREGDEIIRVGGHVLHRECAEDPYYRTELFELLNITYEIARSEIL